MAVLWEGLRAEVISGGDLRGLLWESTLSLPPTWVTKHCCVLLGKPSSWEYEGRVLDESLSGITEWRAVWDESVWGKSRGRNMVKNRGYHSAEWEICPRHMRQKERRLATVWTGPMLKSTMWLGFQEHTHLRWWKDSFLNPYTWH